MKIDPTKLNDDNGHQYINDLIDELRKPAWDVLKKTKFSDASEHELEIMEAIWSHGFAEGAGAATQIISAAISAAAPKTK